MSLEHPAAPMHFSGIRMGGDSESSQKSGRVPHLNSYILSRQAYPALAMHCVFLCLFCFVVIQATANEASRVSQGKLWADQPPDSLW